MATASWLPAEQVPSTHEDTQVQALGHVVLKVRDLQRSENFYVGVLGMQVVLRIREPRMAFFTCGSEGGNHHDFALIELGCRAPSPDDGATGLAHVAFRVASSAEAFASVQKMLHDSRTPVLYEADRGFAKSVHVLDPDGNEVELYLDTSDT
jgi:catechol 2,3-dioxygenase